MVLVYIVVMEETFPHYSEDGIFGTGLVGWRQIEYGGIYRDTNGFPWQWNKYGKRKKPVSEFVSSMRRGKKVDAKKCWYGCDLIYKYSAN